MEHIIKKNECCEAIFILNRVPVNCLFRLCLVISVLLRNIASGQTCIMNFTVNPQSGSCNTLFNFTNLSTPSGGQLQYFWNFDDPGLGVNNTSNLQNPTHTFVTGGVHNVCLIVVRSNPTCRDTFCRAITLNPLASLVDVSGTNFTNCANNSILYDLFVSDSSTGASINNYTIIWGDGSPNYSSSTPPLSLQHTYNGLGYFYLTYIVTTNNGCTDTTIQSVFNGTNPSVGLTNPGNTNGCLPLSLTFPITPAPSNPPGTTYTVTFNDGSAPVVLNHPPPASITHIFNTSSCGATGSPNPNSFFVSILAENPCGSSGASVYPIYLSAPPVADFTFSPDPGCVNQPVTFTNTSINSVNVSQLIGCDSSDRQNWIISPATGWLLSGGALGTSTPPFGGTDVIDITFTTPGIYDVTLIVRSLSSNNCGNDTITKQICVTGPPTAIFTASPNQGCVPLNISTLNNSTVVQNCVPSTYAWAVAFAPISCSNNNGAFAYTNSTTSNSAAPSIVLQDAGNYTLTLTASNVCGSTIANQVISVGSPPIVTVSPINSVCGTITFTPSGTFNGCNQTINTYSWNFPGGTPATSNQQAPPAVTYTNSTANPITYTVTASASNSCGQGTDTAQFLLYPIPVPIASASPDTICQGQSSQLSVLQPGSFTTINWTPGNTTGSPVSVTPNTSTLYTVTVTNTYGCSGTDTVNVSVNPLPVITTGLPINLCQNASPIQLTGATPIGGTWSGAGVTSGGLFNPGSQPVGTINLTYTYTNPITNCVNSGSQTINIIAPPVISITSPIFICNTPGLVNLNTVAAPSPAGGAWFGPFISGGQNFNPVAAGTGIFTVYYTYQGANTCADTVPMIINVILPAIAYAGPDTALCVNASPLVLSGTPLGGTWSGTGVTGNNFDPALAGVGNWTLTYTYGSGSCQSIDQMVVTVNALPVVNAGGAQSFCIDDGAQQLIGIPAGGTWAGTGVNVSGLFNPLTSGVGVHTLTYSYSNANNCSNTSTVNITVNPLPVVDAGVNQSYCDTNLVVQLSGGTPAGGSWSGSNVTTGGALNLGPLLPGQHIYYYTYTDVNGCDAVDSMQVTITAPTPSNAGLDTAMCVNASPLVLSGTPLGGTWSGAGVTGNNFNPALAGVGNWTLTYTYGSGSCQSIDQMVVTVNALPVVNAGVAQSFCIDAGTQQLNGIPAGGTWSGTGVNVSGLFNPLTSGVGVHTLTYSYSNANNCSNTSTVNITVNPLPVVDAGVNQSYCDTNLVVQLSGGTPAGGNWSGSNVTAGGALNLGPLLPGQHIYYYTYTDVNGCDAVDSMQVTITAPTPANAGLDTAICVNASPLVLSGTPLGGTWSGAGVTGNNFDPALVGVGNWTLTFTYGTGTCQSTDQLIAIVNPLPLVDAGLPLQICIDAGLQQLTGLPAGGTWSGTVVNAQGVFDPQLAGTGLYTLYYTFTDANNCINFDSVNVTVNSVPIVNAGPDTSYCFQPIPAQLPVPSPSGGVWSGSGVTNTSVGTFDPTIAGIGQHIIVYTYTDLNGCVNQDTLLVNVISPAMVNAGNDTAICINSTPFVISGIPSGGIWSGPSVQSNGLVNTSTSGSFSLLYSIGSGTCLRTDTLLLIIHPLPFISLSGNIQSICVDQPTVSLTSVPSGGLWSGPGVVNTSFNPGLAGPGNAMLNYFYTDNNGCTNQDSIQIIVHPLPIVFAGNDTTVCDLPIQINLLGSYNNTGIWTGQGVSTSGVFLSPGIGNYSLVYSYTDVNGCENSDTMIVTVVPPQVADAGPGATICEDEPPFILPSFFPASNGNWTGPGIVNAATGLFDPSLALQGSGISTSFVLYYSYGAGNCFTIDSTIVLVHPLPIVDAGVDIDTCISVSAFNLLSFTPFGGWWVGTGIIDSLVGTLDPAIAGAGAYDLVYTYINPITTCRNTDTLIFIVNPLPVPSFQIDSVLCVNANYNLINNSTGGALWFWDFGDGTSSNLQSPVLTYANTGIFSILLIVTSPEGCIDSVRKNVLVVEPPSPSFTLSPDEGCGPMMVSFNNNSVGYNPSYFWIFGNGQTDTLPSPPPVTYTSSLYNDTVYFISLALNNLCGNITVTDSVLVHPSPTSYFGVNVNSGCSPLTINFSNNSYGLPTSYFWDFGDGTTSFDSLPIPHTYFAFTNDTTYYITLITMNACGSDTLIDSITVHPNTVNAFFNTNPTFGCAPLTVNFTNFSTGGNIYSWDFGDGNVSNQYSANHTYTTSGTYTVQFIVTNTCSYDTAISTITVWPQPSLSFTSSIDSACVHESIQFTNTSSDPLINILWDFGDGTQSNQTNISHAYANPGLYTVSLVGTGAVHGCMDTIYSTVLIHPVPAASFDSVIIEGCQPLSVNFTNTSLGGNSFGWNFGDGNNSSQVSPQHTYLNSGQFIVSMIVETPFGCTDTAYGSVTVRPKPQSSFSLSADSGCGTPTTVSFLNTSTTGTGADWSFGDGQVSTLINPSHTYLQTGLFAIQLISTTAFGCGDTAVASFQVHVPPVVSASIIDPDGCEDFLASFINSSQSAIQFEWIFGDGSTSNASSPYHLYLDPGQYTVQLIAIGAGGCTDTLLFNQNVTVYPTPVANFSYNQSDNPALYGWVNFQNESIGATSYHWEFDDGDNTVEEHPEHRYEQYGIYDVELIATGANGCEDTLIRPLDLNFFGGLQVPNAFAPESGTSSDLFSVFLPLGISLERYRLDIYDTWGILLWSTEALQEGRPSEGWDGKVNGIDLPADVYIWKIDALFTDGRPWIGQKRESGSPPRTTGTVTLIR